MRDWLILGVAAGGLVLLGAGLGLSLGPGPALAVPGAVLVLWALAADAVGAIRRS